MASSPTGCAQKGILPTDRVELLDGLWLQWESDLDHEERWEEYLKAWKIFLETEGYLFAEKAEFFPEQLIPADSPGRIHGVSQMLCLEGGKTLKIVIGWHTNGVFTNKI